MGHDQGVGRGRDEYGAAPLDAGVFFQLREVALELQKVVRALDGNYDTD